MLNRNDIYSIIKRILKYFVFLTVIFMFKQCNAYAMTWQENGVMPNMCNAYDITGGASNPCLYISGVYQVHFKSQDNGSALYEFKSYVDIPNPKKYKYINFNILNVNTNLDNYAQYPDAKFGYENSKVLVQIYLDDNTWMNCENNGGADFYCPTNQKGIKRVSAKFFRLSGVASNSWFIFQSTYSWYASENNEIVNQQQQTNDFLNSNDTTQFDNKISNDLSEENLNQKYDALSDYETFINLPTTLFNSLSNTCQPISLTIPFINSNLVLPCPETMYRKILGDQVINIIKIIVNGIFLYRIIMVVIRLIEKTVDPQDDKLEVVEL